MKTPLLLLPIIVSALWVGAPWAFAEDPTGAPLPTATEVDVEEGARDATETPDTAPLDPQALLESMDQNMVFGTRVARVRMTITKGTRVNEKELLMQSKGHDTAFTRFLAPARDEGTKYLKLDKNLWMWLPGPEKQIKISGHMLRQSLMGSDFSYEDMLEAPDMAGRYQATLAGEETINGVPCLVLELKATEKGLTYPTRRVWLASDGHYIVKQGLYALTGKLLKEETFTGHKEFEREGGVRIYPTRFVMRNLLQKDSQTEILLEELRFGEPLDDEVFSLRNLERSD